MTISTVFSLPVLSLANVDTPEGEAAAAAQFRAAAMSTGFLQLVRGQTTCSLRLNRPELTIFACVYSPG